MRDSAATFMSNRPGDAVAEPSGRSVTLTRSLCALAKRTADQHPIAVQLEAGTKVVVLEAADAGRMMNVRSSAGEVYTVFATDIHEATLGD